MIYVALIGGLLCSLGTYEVSLLEDLNISSGIIGIIFAVLGIIASFATKKQEQFHQRFKNKSLSVIGLSITIACMLSGLLGVFSNNIRYLILGIIFMYIVKYVMTSIYYNLTEKYLRNFANAEIDTKIYTAQNLIKSISSAIVGVFASFLLDRMSTAYCMIILGIVFTVLTILTLTYMKTRVGLKPEQYSKEERKYDELKQPEKL